MHYIFGVNSFFFSLDKSIVIIFLLWMCLITVEWMWSDPFYMILPWNCQILHCSAVCTYLLYTGTQELQVIVKVGIFEFQRPFQILNWIRLENQKTCAKLGCVITSSLSPVLNSINHLPLHLQSGIKFERSVVIEWTF